MSLYYLNLKNFQYTKDKHNSTLYDFKVIEGRCHFVYIIPSPIKALCSEIIIRKFPRRGYSILVNFQTPDSEQNRRSI